MESEDLNAIKAKINELKARDPGAFAADAIVVEVKEAAGGQEVGAASANPQFLEIEKRLDRSRRRSSSWMQRLRSVLEEKSDGISAYCTA